MPEAGYVCHSVSGVVGSHRRSVFELQGRSASEATDRWVRPRGTRPGFALRAVPGTRRFSHSVWEKLENRSGEFFKEGRGERSPGTPLAPRPPPGPVGGRRRRRRAPPRATLLPIHEMARVPPGNRFLLPSWRGEGGQPCLRVSSGALAPLAQPQTVHLRRAAELQTQPGSRRFSHIRSGKSLQIVRESFSKKGGGRGAQGRPWLLDHLQAPSGAGAAAGLPDRGPPCFPYTGWHECPPIPGSFSPLGGERGESKGDRRRPGSTSGLQGRRAARSARLGTPSWAASAAAAAAAARGPAGVLGTPRAPGPTRRTLSPT